MLYVIETGKTEAGTTVKILEKKVPGENTTYSVMTATTPSDAGIVADKLTYEQAVKCFYWWLGGCPA